MNTELKKNMKSSSANQIRPNDKQAFEKLGTLMKVQGTASKQNTSVINVTVFFTCFRVCVCV